jgi:hypothetical protein
LFCQCLLTLPDELLPDEPERLPADEPELRGAAELLGADELRALGRAEGLDDDRDERPVLELVGGRADVEGRVLMPLDPACGRGWDGEVRGTMTGRDPEGLRGESTGAREPVDRGAGLEITPVLEPPVTPGVDGVEGRERLTNGLRYAVGCRLGRVEVVGV